LPEEKEYKPTGPYKFPIKKWASLEKMMVTNYPRLRKDFTKLKRKVSTNGENGRAKEKKKHLEWLLNKGENRKAEVICPYCEKKPVKYFLAKYSFREKKFFIKESFAFCEKESCLKEALPDTKPDEAVDILPVRFSSVDKFTSKKDQKRVANLLKRLFGLSSLKSEDLFRFFSE